MTIPYGRTTSVSEQRRRAEEHAAQESAAAEVEAERVRRDRDARAVIAARIGAVRRQEAEQQAARAAAQLAPERARRQREWLVQQPERTPPDFEGQIWPTIREQLLASGPVESRAETEQALRVSGRYTRL